MGVIMHENVAYGGGSVVEANKTGVTPSENLITLTIDGVTYDTTELVFCYDDNGSLYTDSTKATAVTGDESKLYIATNTGKQYRYNGSVFSALGVNAINELSDVTITSASGGQALEYDATAGKWKNVAKKAADTPTFTEASTRANLAGSGETMATILGKIKKWFSDLKTVAFSGSYNDLTNKPTIPAAQVNSDWDASSGVAQILHKPALATVATSGSYNDLSNKPTIPTVNNGTLTIQKNGTQVATFSANQSGNATANITVPDVSETDTTDTTPYLYRASIANGDRCYLEKLVGASFGVNQQCRQLTSTYWQVYSTNYATITFSNGIATVTAKTAASSGLYNFGIRLINNFAVPAGHKYLIRYSVNPNFTANFGDENCANYLDLTQNCPANQWTDCYFIKTAQANKGNSVCLIYFNNVSGGSVAVGNAYQIKDINVIDLTQWFGSAIADAIYAKGSPSGKTYLDGYNFFSVKNIAYNTGSLQSVQTSGKVNTGENLWGGEKLANDIKTAYPSATLDTTNKTIYYTGQGINGIRINTTVYEPNTQYTFILKLKNVTINAYANLNIYYTDGTLQTINKSGTATNTIVTAVFPSAANKTIDHVEGTWGSGNTTLYYEYCGVFKGVVTENDFESYIEHTTTISPIDLRGVPKLVDNNIVYDGDVRDESGRIDRKYGIVDLASLTYTRASNGIYASYLPLAKRPSSNSYPIKGIAGKFEVVAVNGVSGAGKLGVADNDSKTLYVRTTDTSSSSTSDPPTGYLVYELEVSTTEQATPIQNPEIYNQFGWEQFIDDRSFPIPVGHSSEYVNLPDWLEDGYYKDFRQRVDETLPNAIAALANTAVKVIAKNGEYDASVYGLNDMPNCSLSLDKGTYLIMAWCYFTVYNIDTNKEYGCAICNSSNTILSYDGHKNRTESAEGSYGATSSTFILETITTDATVRKLRGYMCKSVTGNPIRGGIVAFKIA